MVEQEISEQEVKEKEAYTIFPRVVYLDPNYSYRDERAELWVVPTSEFAEELVRFLPYCTPLPEVLKVLTKREIGLVVVQWTPEESEAEKVFIESVIRTLYGEDFDHEQIQFKVDRTAYFIDRRKLVGGREIRNNKKEMKTRGDEKKVPLS